MVKIRSRNSKMTPDHPNRILAFLQVMIPGTDQYWSELDVFDDLPAPLKKKCKFKSKGKKEFAVYFDPGPESVMIPRKIRGKIYTPENPEWEENGRLWIRKDDGDVWKRKAGVRMFDAETGEYLQYRHIDFERLETIDPNDPSWKKYYNAFFRQLLNRDIKVKKISRNTWLEAKKIVIYKAINEWCKEEGVNT
jgi:hypothetical protein